MHLVRGDFLHQYWSYSVTSTVCHLTRMARLLHANIIWIEYSLISALNNQQTSDLLMLQIRCHPQSPSSAARLMWVKVSTQIIPRAAQQNSSTNVAAARSSQWRARRTSFSTRAPTSATTQQTYRAAPSWSVRHLYNMASMRTTRMVARLTGLWDVLEDLGENRSNLSILVQMVCSITKELKHVTTVKMYPVLIIKRNDNMTVFSLFIPAAGKDGRHFCI